jgi:Rrf2 family protein
MRLSRASNYALHALAFLAGRAPAGPVASHHLAEADHTPDRFLLKVLRPLVSAGLLRSLKGPNGGYRLARPADKITLLEVVEAVEGPVRGEAPRLNGKGVGPLDARLQAICEQAAEQTRKGLAKVRLSHLVADVGEGKAKGRRKEGGRGAAG